MSLPRRKVDRLAALTCDALIDQMEKLKREDKPVPATTLVAALKLIGQIEVPRGDTPVVPSTTPAKVDAEAESGDAKVGVPSFMYPFRNGEPNPDYDAKRSRTALLQSRQSER